MDWRHRGCADKDECPFVSCLIEGDGIGKPSSAMCGHTRGCERPRICVFTGVRARADVSLHVCIFE